MGEEYTGPNLFKADYQDGKWQNWRYAGDKLNNEYQVGELHITADGVELYFHSSRKGGKGGYDIWVSKKLGAEWQNPRMSK